MAEKLTTPCNVGCLLGNILMAIAIVLVNKTLYNKGFPNVSMTCIHFLWTTVGMLVCLQVGLFKFKRAPLIKMAPVALTFCGFVVFTNLSLLYNTVGTYQIMKSSCTPCVIFLQSYFYGRHFSNCVKLTVVKVNTLYRLSLISCLNPPISHVSCPGNTFKRGIHVEFTWNHDVLLHDHFTNFTDKCIVEVTWFKLRNSTHRLICVCFQFDNTVNITQVSHTMLLDVISLWYHPDIIVYCVLSLLWYIGR